MIMRNESNFIDFGGGDPQLKNYRNGSGRQDTAKRQSGDAATRWPITVLLSNGSNTEQDQDNVL